MIDDKEKEALLKKEPTLQAAELARKNIVAKIGQTGCAVCDANGKLKCNCPSQKGEDSDHEKENKNDDKKTTLEFTNQIANDQRCPALVPLEQIQTFYKQFVQKLANELLTTPEALEKEGYRSEIKNGVLTLTFANAEQANIFLKQAYQKRMILFPSQKAAHDDTYENNSEIKNQKQNNYRSPNPFKNPGQIPKLTR